jgi:hypothetical protein
MAMIRFARNADAKNLWQNFTPEKHRKTDALRGVEPVTKRIGINVITKTTGITGIVITRAAVEFAGKMLAGFLNI